MWAFNLCAFRQGSKNCLQTTLDSLSKKDQEGFAKLLGIENHDIPHSSTVDYGLSRIPHEEINKIFLNQIDALIKKKLFYNHSELSPGNTLNIGIDGYLYSVVSNREKIAAKIESLLKSIKKGLGY